MYAAIPNAAAWNMESWPVKPKIRLKLTAAIARMKLKMKIVRMKLLWTRTGKMKKGTQSKTFIAQFRTGPRVGRVESQLRTLGHRRRGTRLADRSSRSLPLRQG